MNKPRLLLADDHVIVADALKSMLAPYYDVVGIASDGRTLLHAAETLKPDLIVVDIITGIEMSRTTTSGISASTAAQPSVTVPTTVKRASSIGTTVSRTSELSSATSIRIGSFFSKASSLLRWT
jgi:DNA-binding NarL/FixJ family response regulator